jgi:hypothetical protein
LATQAALLRQRFAGAAVIEEFLACLLKQHKNHPESVLEGVLQLLEPVSDPTALRVLSDAAELGMPEAATIAKLLECQLAAAPGQNAPTAPLNRPVPALDVERPLSVYASALPQPSEETSQ